MTKLASLSKLATKTPVFEHIMVEPSESFLWRCDDYPWERNVWNYHPEYEIHLIRNASGVALVGDHIGHFGPGHLTVVGSGLPHDWVTVVTPGTRILQRDIVLQFDPERIRSAASVLPELSQVEAFLKRGLRGLSFHGETQRTAAAMLEEMGRMSALARLSHFLRLLHLLSVSEDYEVLSSETFTPNLDLSALATIQRALGFIHQNFNRDIALGDVASMFDMSETAFSRFFKKNTGNTFSDHVTILRVAEACKLLSDTTTAITDICFEVGYSNISNFNRKFKERRGMTPSRYRDLARRRTRSRLAV
ncbi:MAG: AraC family transcriptional regulator [Bradyrhizobium sp.]|jgi:AraC-like DNA-binding protein|uniref:AraC family transcriptional regulator n=1 Tax=Bradyrhizobium sp. TaxID=376 RepID=UPI003C7AEC67